MADEVPVTFRINSDRDASMCIRKDMSIDLEDMLKDIKKANGYNLDVVTNCLWRVDDFSLNELPGNMVFVTDSDEDTTGSRFEHKLEVVFEHVNADGKNTNLALLDGAQDILTCWGKTREGGQNFADRFCKKYTVTSPPKLVNIRAGLESKRKTEGAIDLVFMVEYASPMWTL
jgi:hypothetical protein